MNRNTRYISFLLIIFTIVTASSCSDSSTNPEEDPNGGGSDLGEVSFTVIADVDEYTHSGQADFEVFSGAGHFWILSMHDFGPQTFSLDFSLAVESETYRPAPGTYKVRGHYLGENIFNSNYELFQNKDYENPVTFLTNGFCQDAYPHGGELTITGSSEDEVEGSFDLTLIHLESENNSTNCGTGTVLGGAAQLKGEFRATPVIR